MLFIASKVRQASGGLLWGYRAPPAPCPTQHMNKWERTDRGPQLESAFLAFCQPGCLLACSSSLVFRAVSDPVRALKEVGMKLAVS